MQTDRKDEVDTRLHEAVEEQWVVLERSGEVVVEIPAQEAGVAALSDDAHQVASRELVREWRPRLAQAIRGMGFEVFPSAGNFVLVRFPDEAKSARDADAFLHSRGLIVRPVGGYGLTDCLRITVGTPEQNGVLLDALQAFAEI